MSVEQLEQSVLKLSAEDRRQFARWFYEHEDELAGRDGKDIDPAIKAEILRRRDEAEACPELLQPWDGTTERVRARLHELRDKKPRLVDDDLLSAANWYDRQLPGLGDEFLDEAEAVITSHAANALLYAVRFEDVRCVRLKRFQKYGVFYVIRGDEVRLLAIHHGSRDPHWLEQRSRKQLG